jgi:hypothetical protein
VLGVSAPASVLLGKPFTLSVSRYANATGKRSAADGALVSGGGKRGGTTGANGKATLAISQGRRTSTIDVSAANSIRDEATVCVHKARRHLHAASERCPADARSSASQKRLVAAAAIALAATALGGCGVGAGKTPSGARCW